MRAYGDEFVVVSVGEQPEVDLTEITINCPDKVGLGCDIARIVFEFGVSITRGGDTKFQGPVQELAMHCASWIHFQ